MGKQLWVVCVLGVFLSLSAQGAEEVRYIPDTAPPSVGYDSAMKYFTRAPTSESSVSSNWGGNSDAEGDSAFFFDQNFFVNNKYVSDDLAKPRFGLNLGYEWDQSWYGTGIYINYVSFERGNESAEKFSVTGGFYYPRIESGFPLYGRANVGLGYYSNDLDNKGATVDYNAALGIRFFFSGSWLFNVEVGSRNYARLLKSDSSQSIVVGSGLALTF